MTCYFCMIESGSIKGEVGPTCKQHHVARRVVVRPQAPCKAVRRVRAPKPPKSPKQTLWATDEVIRQAYIDGCTYRQIEAVFRCGQDRIQRIVKSIPTDVPVLRPKPPGRVTWKVDEPQMRELYANGASLAQLQRQFRVGRRRAKRIVSA